MATHLTRREFVLASGAALMALEGSAMAQAGGSANDKLNIAVVGVSGRGGDNLAGVRGENIVALCDVDETKLAAVAKGFPSAKTYTDFRRMLDQKGIDAVVVSTPDHTHAPATLMALRAGKHVYCEKPLTHTVAEARLVAETAKKQKRVTQMGTQIHAEPNYRRVVEIVRSGAIGPIREVHNWVSGAVSGGDLPTDTPPVPPELHWDLWLGPAPERAYNPVYAPFRWRGWWAFGSGTLGDFGCHHMDLPYWALDLRYPTSVEATGPAVHPESTPEWLEVRYEYPARGAMPPVTLTWHHGDKKPPQMANGSVPTWGAGTLFVGEKGMLLSDYSHYVLLPEKDFAGYKPPAPTIPDSIGHHAEWIQACKTGGPTTCNFDYSGALAEAVLLGNVAYRVGKKLEWDAKRLKAANCPEADALIHGTHRSGWGL